MIRLPNPLQFSIFNFFIRRKRISNMKFEKLCPIIISASKSRIFALEKDGVYQYDETVERTSVLTKKCMKQRFFSVFKRNSMLGLCTFFMNTINGLSRMIVFRQSSGKRETFKWTRCCCILIIYIHCTITSVYNIKRR